MAVLGINYSDVYKSVVIRFSSDEKMEFATGNPVADFESAIDFLCKDGNAAVLFSSSVHDFVSDIPGYRYDEDHMLVIDNSKSFETESEAGDWMDNYLKDENCKDNYRFAFADNYWEMVYYEAQQDDGCCGYFDKKILVQGRPAWIGCNYGH
jgi:hypothetical protein